MIQQMMDRIHIGDEHAFDAGRRIMALANGGVFNPASEVCIARFVDGSFVGGVVYSNCTQASAEMTVLGVKKRWLNRDLLWVAFDYPFNQLGMKKVFARIRMSNTASLRFNAGLGFTDEAVLRDVFPDCDMIIRSMYKADCRFLNITPKTIRSRGVQDVNKAEGTGGS